MNKLKLTLALCFAGFIAAAQETTTPAPVAESGLSNTDIMVIVMCVFMTLIVAATWLLLKVVKVLYVESTSHGSIEIKKAKKRWDDVEQEGPTLWEKLLSLRPIKEEKDLELHHAYDGITELNNPVPSWFNILFYGTILFGVVYLIIYQFSGIGAPQQEEYVMEVAKANADKLAEMKRSGVKIDENTVTVDTSAAVIENGRTVFANNCIACHGDKAQGLVGPNLTDEYWLHGGGIKNIFTTIKYGVPEKGMVPWGRTMSAKNISDIANFLLILRGSKPANAKAPQGTLYVEEKAEGASGDDKGAK